MLVMFSEGMSSWSWQVMVSTHASGLGQLDPGNPGVELGDALEEADSAALQQASMGVNSSLSLHAMHL